jgi:hypothetical protein
MTRMRWIAVIALLLALVIRVSHRYVSFELAYAVAPGVHRGIPISEPLFWVLLVLGAILLAASFSRDHHRER